MSELGSLLARWHDWRVGFSHERKLARVAQPDTDADEDEKLERMLLASVEEEISRMPREMQLALAHVARNASLGYAVFHSPRLPEGEALEKLTAEAERRLLRRLVYLGLI